MTTIAYRNGVVAADRRVTNAGWIVSDLDKKLTRLDDGRVLAESGDSCAIGALKEWVTCPQSATQPNGDCKIIEFTGDKITVYEGGGAYALNPDAFYAWGSGFPAALGALWAGADAEKAIEAAAMVDPCTGGGVDVMRIGN